MYKPKYFKLSEFIHSDTAINNKFENIPDWNGINKLLILAERLDMYREALNEEMYITSGYRCPYLNKLVGGSITSHHCKCDAVDLQIGKRSKYDAIRLYNFIKNYNIENNLNVDQVFLEHKSSNNSWWVHLGLNVDEPDKMRNYYGELNV